MVKSKVIVITGTPGTGKSTIAEELSLSKRWKLIKIKDFVKKHNLAESFDVERNSDIVDPKALSKALLDEINSLVAVQGIIIDGHMSHYLPKKAVDLCIVTKTGLAKLNTRLKKRKYPKAKVNENMESEIFNICYEEAKEAGHKILTIDTTTKSPKQLLKEIENYLDK